MSSRRTGDANNLACVIYSIGAVSAIRKTWKEITEILHLPARVEKRAAVRVADNLPQIVDAGGHAITSQAAQVSDHVSRIREGCSGGQKRG
jgi:hypothetical protein